jgi:proline iminopeptidase
MVQSTNVANFFYYDEANIPADDPAAPESNWEMAMALIGTERPELVDELAEVDVPTLILAALWDRHVGFDMPRDLATRLPRPTLEIFTRSAHSIADEEPTKYVETIRAFLGR